MALLPLDIQSREQLRAMLRDAKQRVGKELEFDPKRTFILVVMAQLEFIEECSKGGRNPTQEETERISSGPIAVGNLEEEDPDLAHWFSEISCAFKRTWSSLP